MILRVKSEGRNSRMWENHVSSFESHRRERENSVFVYRNKQAGAKTRWVRYIAVHYWLHPSFRGGSAGNCSELGVDVGGEVVGWTGGERLIPPWPDFKHGLHRVLNWWSEKKPYSRHDLAIMTPGCRRDIGTSFCILFREREFPTAGELVWAVYPHIRIALFTLQDVRQIAGIARLP